MDQNKETSPLNLPPIDAAWPRLEETTRLQAAVDEIANDVQVSHEMALTTALGALSVACQAGYMVKMPEKNVVHPVSLMLLTVAESGERKTALETKFFKSIREFQINQEKENRRRLRKHLFEQEIWNTKRKALLAELRKAVIRGDSSEDIEQRLEELAGQEPANPITINLLHEDTTPQALLSAMNANLPVACLLSSEADGILNGLAMQNNSSLNALWSGSDVTVGRTTRDSFTITDGRLTAALMTQRSSVDYYLEKRGKRARGSGLLARFLTVYPRSLLGHRDTRGGSSVNTPYCDEFNKRVMELLNNTLKEENGKLPTPTIMEFTPHAANEWKLTAEIIEEQCRAKGTYQNATDHASKLMENIGRVAALVHLCEDHKGNINEKTFLYARDVCMHYSQHFLENLVPPTQAQKDANNLYDKMYAYHDQFRGHFETNWMLRYAHLTRQRLDEALLILEESSYLQRIDDKCYRFYPDTMASRPRLSPGSYRKYFNEWGSN